MRILSWLLRAFIFFTLFAFALNNQQPVTVHWFFGVVSQAPMVLVVLAAFIAGCVLGTLAMLPGWWRRRQPRSATSTTSTLERDARTSVSSPHSVQGAFAPLDSDTPANPGPRHSMPSLDDPGRAGA